MTPELGADGACRSLAFGDSADESAAGAPQVPPTWWYAWLALCCLALWVSIADHPLYSPDEGRYAAVAKEMARSGDWIVPRFRGEVHLTKPPLYYWLAARAIKSLGPTELAVRLPSVVAANTLLLMVFFAGPRNRRRVGILAAAVLVCMPLFLIVSRLAITDPTLNACWFGTLLAGLRCVQTRHRRYAAAMWLAVALGLLAKGPVALLPLAILVIWRGLARDWRSLASLRPLLGLPLATIPLLTWVVLVLKTQDGAFALWHAQIVGRIVGEQGISAHVEPLWFYLPIFVAGLYPATIMLVLPWMNVRWPAALRAVQRGDDMALWIVAVIVPLLVFSAMAGKVATYLLPLAVPLSLIAASNLDRWLSVDVDEEQSRGLPNIVHALFIVNALMAVGTLIGLILWRPYLWPLSVSFFLLIAASFALCAKWRVNLRVRFWASVAVWITALAVMFASFEIEDRLLGESDQRIVLERIPALTGVAEPHLALFGFKDPTINFYWHGDVERINTARELLQALGRHGRSLVLIADPRDWSDLAEKDEPLTSRFQVVATERRWLDKQELILVER